MNSGPGLVWFRRDLRLADNAALRAAVENCSSILPVFLWAPEEDAPWAPGAASRWWLHQSLLALEAELAGRGAKLVIRRGPATEALLLLVRESGAKSVYWNRCYEPAMMTRDRKLEILLRERGIFAETFPGDLLFEPSAIKNSSGKPFQRFTAFWRCCLAMPAPAKPESAPRRFPPPANWPESLGISDLALEPKVNWAYGMRRRWQPGETGTAQRLRSFRKKAMQTYSVDRNRPDHFGTSSLSPHLHFGEISVRQVWDAISRGSAHDEEAGAQEYLRQIAWREFARHTLFHFPAMPREPLTPEFRDFPWRRSRQCAAAWKRWTRGETGYPLVDAGMRQLWHTGWMHNRVRMVAASFLVKHLLIDWRDGEAWFWDTLVDADLANNSMGWQWSAGCGVDAAPYFRIFNPVIQGRKFDPNGEYVRRWVPEIAGLPNAWIHQPWKAPASLLAEAEIEPGKTYPMPMIAHEEARKRALKAFAGLKRI